MSQSLFGVHQHARGTTSERERVTSERERVTSAARYQTTTLVTGDVYTADDECRYPTDHFANALHQSAHQLQTLPVHVDIPSELNLHWRSSQIDVAIAVPGYL